MDGFDRMEKRASDLCGTRVRLPTSPQKVLNGLDTLCLVVYTIGMASKSQVQRKADKTGCELIVDGNLVTLYPPDGFTFGEYRCWVANQSQAI
jgi:hypothetical protein